MNRLIIIAAMILLSVRWAAAVEPPAVTTYLNGRPHKDAKASEAVVTGSALKPYDLDEYRGLTLTDSPAEAAKIEKAVVTDARTAADREISYRDGKIYYAFLTLPPRDGRNRYVFYLNQHLVGGDKIVLIYMRGKADAAQIKKMIKK